MTKNEPVLRQVIDDQLLTALDDKSKVAVVLSEEDLTILIDAVLLAAGSSRFPEFYQRHSMLTDLRRLRDAAFGRGKKSS